MLTEVCLQPSCNLFSQGLLNVNYAYFQIMFTQFTNIFCFLCYLAELKKGGFLLFGLLHTVIDISQCSHVNKHKF